MIPRYSRPKMAAIWEDTTRLQIWLEVELLACEAMVEEGAVPIDVARRIRNCSIRFTEEDVRAIEAIEEQTRHDVIAFLTFLEQKLGPDARFLHLGMTSSDVLDTTLAVQLDRAAGILLDDLDGLRKVLQTRALEHRRTAMIGRTHGIHAEPVTFGLVLALWWAELGRQRHRLEEARREVAVGKLSGAVGTYAHLSPRIEEKVCAALGLGTETVSNQVVQRDRHAHFFCALANLGATIEKIAVNLRHFQRTEVGETREPFAAGQKGSSAMPHKRNPIGCENLTGIARLLRGYAVSALENVALWHERDISHSSVERVIAPDATILADYAMARLTRILEALQVDVRRMRENLDLLGGVIFSEGVLLSLVRQGMERQAAYRLIQRCALAAQEQRIPFDKALLQDEEVAKALGRDAIENCFDLERTFNRVEHVFARIGIFTEGKGSET
ncbi:MAG: adenylosuccinate lyase [Myxococcales bacterium]|nr:adenylosuccinate lyase [Myxococcales bacterium]